MALGRISKREKVPIAASMAIASVEHQNIRRALSPRQASQCGGPISAAPNMESPGSQPGPCKTTMHKAP